MKFLYTVELETSGECYVEAPSADSAAVDIRVNAEGEEI